MSVGDAGSSFYVPLTAFVVVLLFPFYWMVITTIRPDSELYQPWSAPNYKPFWTMASDAGAHP